ncbi:TlpA family protein disulfide reductase [Caenimonas aquaedulcis]|uniref:TlpA family protein disulfide reductase n=1 Tax=Caenimonas aquaedulcis TaxID=2793270 RepID=A0A931H6Y2_9BURK|nr:TlpA disulfide reductase family protein [Caenimonas aquaedulcis]MBG9389814.1 TlpA family protein disulfide reductase [Caenimonas aquaedulcis]
MQAVPQHRTTRRVRRWVLAGAVALLAPVAAFALDRGDPAPDFTLQGPAGTVRLADLQGKLVLVDFWASWCGPCKQSFPWMNEMQARYRDRGLRIVGVNVDRRATDADRFLERIPAGFTLAFDAAGEVPRQYGVKAMPTSVLVGPDGRVLEIHSGFSDDERAAREQKIRQSLPPP